VDFVLWACRAVHLVSVVVWIGGLIFLNAIWKPLVDHEEASRTRLNLETILRFQPFVWSSVWPLLVTGLLLMVLSPRFLWFEYSTWWAKLLAVKQLAFLALLFFAWQMMKVTSRLEQTAGNDAEEFAGWWLAYSKLLKRSILAGSIALVSGAALMVV
jgi:uncharacterized membrane protein